MGKGQCKSDEYSVHEFGGGARRLSEGQRGGEKDWLNEAIEKLEKSRAVSQPERIMLYMHESYA